MATRPSKPVTFLAMARLLSMQSTCIRRQVGCILLDEHWHIIGSGYNGVGKGLPHCIDNPCAGANCESGTNLHICEAIHAEQNALMQCHDIHKIKYAVCTTSPCMHCMKMLLNTSCEKIIHTGVYDELALDLWRSSGRLSYNISASSKDDWSEI